MNNTILITGASSGIGKATAIHFQQKGWNVIATMRKPEDEDTLKQLDNVLITALDVLDLDSINKAINDGIDRFGKIDALVNNAGYGAYGPLEAFPRENILRQFNTNVIGLLDVTRVILPHFRANKAGTVVNISSIGGKMTFPLGSLYHGTKFAVEGISEALSYEVAGFGGKIKIVEPGAIETDFGGRSFDFQNNEELEEYQDVVKALFATFETFSNASPASLVAEVIHQAVTDGTNQLRYTVGADAEQFMGARKTMSDDEFMGMLKGQLNLN